MELKELLQAVYEQGYEDGWAKSRATVPLIGSGSLKVPADIKPELNTEKWSARFDRDEEVHPDDIEVFYVEATRGSGSWKEERPFMHTTVPNEARFGSLKRQVQHERDLHHSFTINKVRPAKDYIQGLEERLRAVQDENDALRATHPGAQLDEWEEDHEDAPFPDEWELEVSAPKNTYRVPLSGSHPFDRADIEIEIDVSADVEKCGRVNAHVKIEDLELVSSK